MSYDLFSNLSQPIKQLNQLKISVDYEKGGFNYFTGDKNKRGIYIYFTPIKENEDSFQVVLLGSKKESGFKTCVKELNRKNAKAIKDVFDKINNNEFIEKVTKLYEEEKYQEIVKIIFETIN